MADPAAADWGWWRERRLPAGPLHLDTAAAGRSSLATLAATAAHAEREATSGAYVAQEEAEPLLAEGRANLARLLGVPDGGVAFVPSAQAALDTLLAIWPLREGDAVAVVPCEWGPNLDAFAAKGLRATNGQDIGKTRSALLPGIVTTAASTLRAPRDMTEPLLRVSPHVDCTAGDLDRLRQALLALD